MEYSEIFNSFVVTFCDRQAAVIVNDILKVLCRASLVMRQRKTGGFIRTRTFSLDPSFIVHSIPGSSKSRTSPGIYLDHRG